MNNYFLKTLEDTCFNEAIENVTEAVKEEGLGILTKIYI
tara:strand:- start:8490 stop:8606 length:117 start_codon:yes stop_codon:yes gene_type:complete